MRTRHVIGLGLAVVVLAGCAGQLRTGPQNACDAALISGILARSQATGFGLQDPEGVVQPVIWPFGFAMRQDLTTVVLIDATGRTVAREGDRIEAGGGANGEGVFAICPADSIKVRAQND